MTASRIILAFVLLAAAAASAFAQTQHVAREQDIVGLRLGQRVMVDDGTCPSGQIKEVSGARMTPSGVTPARTCVPRLAATSAGSKGRRDVCGRWAGEVASQRARRRPWRRRRKTFRPQLF